MLASDIVSRCLRATHWIARLLPLKGAFHFTTGGHDFPKARCASLWQRTTNTRFVQRHIFFHASVDFWGRLSRLCAPYDLTDTAKHCTNSRGDMRTSQPHAQQGSSVAKRKPNRKPRPLWSSYSTQRLQRLCCDVALSRF